MPGLIILLVGGVVLFEFFKTKTTAAQPLSATQLALLQQQRAQATQAGSIASALSKLTQALGKPASSGGSPKPGSGGSSVSAGPTQTGFQSPSNQSFNTLDNLNLPSQIPGQNDLVPGTGFTVAELEAQGFTADDIAALQDQASTDLTQTNGVIGSVPEAPTGLDNSLFGLTGAGVPQLDSTGVGTGQDVALNEDVGITDFSSADDFSV